MKLLKLLSMPFSSTVYTIFGFIAFSLFFLEVGLWFLYLRYEYDYDFKTPIQRLITLLIAISTLACSAEAAVLAGKMGHMASDKEYKERRLTFLKEEEETWWIGTWEDSDFYKELKEIEEELEEIENEKHFIVAANIYLIIYSGILAIILFAFLLLLVIDWITGYRRTTILFPNVPRY